MTKPTQKQRLFTRNNFAEHNYNYVNRSQTTKPSLANTQNTFFLHRQNFQQPSSNSENLMTTQKLHNTKVKIINVFNKTKIIYNKTEIEIDIEHIFIHLLTFFHQMMKNITIKIINIFIKTKDSTLTR